MIVLKCFILFVQISQVDGRKVLQIELTFPEAIYWPQ